jgi:hypothetical protein
VVIPAKPVDPAELIEFCRGRIASYAVPKRVDFVDSLPRNPAGKVLKREVRDRYFADGARLSMLAQEVVRGDLARQVAPVERQLHEAVRRAVDRVELVLDAHAA